MASHAQQATPNTQTLPSAAQGLNAIFAPKNVDVIGATERQGSAGRTILWNLISSPFGGTIYPVNPTRSSILGIRAYPNLAELAEQVELAVIGTRARSVPNGMRECAANGVKGVVVISAGFMESGGEGAVKATVEGGGQPGDVLGDQSAGFVDEVGGLEGAERRGGTLDAFDEFVAGGGQLEVRGLRKV